MKFNYMQDLHEVQNLHGSDNHKKLDTPDASGIILIIKYFLARLLRN